MEITVDELRGLGPAGATIINAGKHAGRAEIRGAIRYRPHDLLEAEHLALPLAHGVPVVLYDETGDGDHTAKIAAKLEADGWNVRTLSGGFRAWEAAGGDVQEPSMEQVVPPMRPDEVQSLDRRL